MLIAYAWASGVIGFGNDVPDYATRILSGDADRLRHAVKRHASALNGGTLLVPGMAESNSRRAKYEVLSVFIKRVRKTYKRNRG